MPTLSFLAAGDDWIDQSCQCGSDHRGDPEEPELSECPPSHEERGAGAARGVNGEIRDRDSDQVNEGQAKADRRWARSTDEKLNCCAKIRPPTELSYRLTVWLPTAVERRLRRAAESCESAFHDHVSQPVPPHLPGVIRRNLCHLITAAKLERME